MKGVKSQGGVQIVVQIVVERPTVVERRLERIMRMSSELQDRFQKKGGQLCTKQEEEQGIDRKSTVSR